MYYRLQITVFRRANSKTNKIMKLTSKQIKAIIAILRTIIELIIDLSKENKKGGKYEREHEKGDAEQ